MEERFTSHHKHIWLTSIHGISSAAKVNGSTWKSSGSTVRSCIICQPVNNMAGAAQFTKDLKMNATGSVEVKKPTMSARLSIAAQHIHT